MLTFLNLGQTKFIIEYTISNAPKIVNMNITLPTCDINDAHGPKNGTYVLQYVIGSRGHWFTQDI